VNGEARVLAVPPLRRLLDVLRDDLGLTGTKEGCGEGECGACTVLVDGEAVNACLVPACQADGSDVTTIEGSGHSELQRAFVAAGGTQCGICTPGMVMMARAWLEACARCGTVPTAEAARAALAGNLCRCTGYGKIVASVLAAVAERGPFRSEPRPSQPEGPQAAGALEVGPDSAGHRVHERPRTLARRDHSRGRGPSNLAAAEDLATALAALAAGARPMAGGTDAMVQWGQGAPPPERLVDVWRVGSLRGVSRDGGGVRLGALTTCSDLLRLDPASLAGADLWQAAARDFAAEQIRNRATIGGNLATASPASDLAPVLLALGGVVRLRAPAAVRDVPAEAFFTGYRRTACRPDELIDSVWVPDRPRGEQRALRKVGTRAAQAIAKVSLAVCVELAGGRIAAVRAAAGSVADRPVLLASLLRLVGEEPTAATLTAAARAAALLDCAPIDDVRSTARYRRHVLARLLATMLASCCGCGTAPP